MERQPEAEVPEVHIVSAVSDGKTHVYSTPLLLSAVHESTVPEEGASELSVPLDGAASPRAASPRLSVATVRSQLRNDDIPEWQRMIDIRRRHEAGQLRRCTSRPPVVGEEVMFHKISVARGARGWVLKKGEIATVVDVTLHDNEGHQRYKFVLRNEGGADSEAFFVDDDRFLYVSQPAEQDTEIPILRNRYLTALAGVSRHQELLKEDFEQLKGLLRRDASQDQLSGKWYSIWCHLGEMFKSLQKMEEDGLQTQSLEKMQLATRKEALPQVTQKERLQVFLQRFLKDMDEAMRALAAHINEAYPVRDDESQESAAAVPGIDRNVSLEAIPVDQNGQPLPSMDQTFTEWLLCQLGLQALVLACRGSDGRSCACVELLGLTSHTSTSVPSPKRRSSPSSSQSRSPCTPEAEEEQQAEAEEEGQTTPDEEVFEPIRVRLKYLEASEPAHHYDKRVTIPRTWARGPCRQVVEFFVDYFNKAHPDTLLIAADFHLKLADELHNRGRRRTFGKHLRNDSLVFESGIYKDTTVEPELHLISGPILVKCNNIGCQLYFDPDGEAQTCWHHDSAPAFHDTRMWWPCCRPDRRGFDEIALYSIQGCKKGTCTDAMPDEQRNRARGGSDLVASDLRGDNAPNRLDADAPVDPRRKLAALGMGLRAFQADEDLFNRIWAQRLEGSSAADVEKVCTAFQESFTALLRSWPEDDSDLSSGSTQRELGASSSSSALASPSLDQDGGAIFAAQQATADALPLGLEQWQGGDDDAALGTVEDERMLQGL